MPDQSENAVEIRLRALELANAVATAHRETQAAEMARLHGRFDKLEGYLAKLFWILVAGIGGSVVSFIVNGGLALAKP